MCRNEVQGLVDSAKKFSEQFKGVGGVIGLFPSMESLEYVQNLCADSEIEVGAQDVSEYVKGSYTGQVSAVGVKGVGASFSLCGHTESCKQWLQDVVVERVVQKVYRCWEAGLCPVICFEKNALEEGGLVDVIAQNCKGPVCWAFEESASIGSGQVSDLSVVDNVHKQVRARFPENVWRGFLYGGSVAPQNIKDFISLGVDGVLVGGASQEAMVFAHLLQQTLLNL